MTTNYEKTSQLTSWQYTPEQLTNVRTRANTTAIIFLHEWKQKQKTVQQARDTAQNQNESSAAVVSDTNKETTNGIGKSDSADAASTNKPTEVPSLSPQCFAKHEKNTDTPPPPIGGGEQEELDMAKLHETYLTPQEEQALLQFYATKLPSLIGPKAKLPQLCRPAKVATTAVTLLKRFYLSNSVMMHDPKAMMVAAAFLACKVEDSVIHIKYLEDGTKLLHSHVPVPTIIKAEISLMNGVNFDLLCFHPYTTILAYSNDLRSFKTKLKDGTTQRYVSVSNPTTTTTKSDNTNNDAKEEKSNTDTSATTEEQQQSNINARDLLGPVYDEAKRLVETILCGKNGDVGLMATPGQIGLAALYLANQRLLLGQKKDGDDANNNENSSLQRKKHFNVVQIDFKGYIEHRFVGKEDGVIGSANNSTPTEVWEQVQKVAKELEDELGWEQDMQVLKAIHKKLKKCRVLGDDGNSTSNKKSKKKKKKSKKRKRTDDAA